MIDRFWAKVDVCGPDECWEWQGALNSNGYGGFHPRSQIIIGAHRVMYEITTGEQIPDGLVVTHSCDNPACVNPAHLALGTYRANAQEMIRRGRSVAKLTEQEAREIKYREDKTQRALGAEYGISQMQVSRIKRGLTWAYV